jgi:hypothetical protein
LLLCHFVCLEWNCTFSRAAHSHSRLVLHGSDTGMPEGGHQPWELLMEPPWSFHFTFRSGIGDHVTDSKFVRLFFCGFSNSADFT